MYQNDPAKVLTGEVRLSYVHLIEPRTNKPGDDPKYSATLLIPKTDFATKADIDASIQAAAQDAVSKVWNGAAPPQLRVPIYDGDGVRQSGEPFGEECRGHWVMSASTFNKPQVVGIQNINQELPPREVYSGMYARVTIRFSGYPHSGNKGIGCGLCTTRCEFDAIHLHRERAECSTMIKSEDKMKAILPNMVKREIRIKRAAKKNRK